MSRGKEFYSGLVGQKYSHLTIEKFIGFNRKAGDHKRAVFLCRCECGNEKTAILPHLKNENVTSCGCKKKGRFNRAWSGYEGLGSTVWSQFKNGAIKRNIPFEVSIEYGWDLFRKQEGRCALTGVELKIMTERRYKTASLDRIESSKGYIEGNVQWTHKDVNVMKRSLNNSEFIDFCHKVARLHPINDV